MGFVEYQGILYEAEHFLWKYIIKVPYPAETRESYS
jgi:hypothetical protein